MSNDPEETLGDKTVPIPRLATLRASHEESMEVVVPETSFYRGFRVAILTLEDMEALKRFELSAQRHNYLRW